MTEFVHKETVEKLVPIFSSDPGNPYTLSELIGIAEDKGASLSHLVVAQAMRLNVDLANSLWITSNLLAVLWAPLVLWVVRLL